MERDGDRWERIPGRERLFRIVRDQDDVRIFGEEEDIEIPTLPGENGAPIVNRESRRPLRVSNFHITVSSNARWRRLREYRYNEVGTNLMTTSNWLFGRSHQGGSRDFLDIFDIIGAGNRPDGRHPAPTDIYSIRWTPSNFEHGDDPRGSRVHLHGDLKVLHYTKLRVNQKRCQEYLNNLLTFNRDQNVIPSPPAVEQRRMQEIKGVYVRAEYFRDADNNYLYGNKNIIARLIRELGDRLNS